MHHFSLPASLCCPTAAAACVNFAFGELGLNRLIASMHVKNTPSIRVAGKIGMKREKEFFNKNNRGLLTYLYSIRKTQYVQKIFQLKIMPKQSVLSKKQ